LGADIPFCLLGGLAKAEGVGEGLTPLPLPPPLPLLLVNPGFSVSTARVFKHYAQNKYAFADKQIEQKTCTKLALALRYGNIQAIWTLQDNDLAKSARLLYPALGKLEQRLRGIKLMPLLCGSGSTILALTENATILSQAKQALANLPWVHTEVVS
jgi:4-diphosphocytidyl-2-C-methyl-D-erythritol kinase